MKSTGEVMGVAPDYPAAFGKAQAAAGVQLPAGGTVFISVTDGDKAAATQLAAGLHDVGFKVLATRGTAQAIRGMGVPVERIMKLTEGSPNVVDRIEAGEVDLVINTPTGSGARADGYEIRRAAVARGVPCITTLSGASAAQRAIRASREGQPEPISLQELHRAVAAGQLLRHGPAVTAIEPRTLAPPERRTVEVVGCEALGAYTVLWAIDREGPPDPQPGQFYMLSTAERWGGGACERPYLPRAFSFARALLEGDGIRLAFLLEEVGPGTERLARLEPGDGLVLVGPLGIGFRPAREGRRPLLVGGGIGTAPLLCLSDELEHPAGDAGLSLGSPRRGRGAVRR